MGKPKPRIKKRKSRRKLGSRPYRDYSAEMLEIAVESVANKKISSREAEKQFGIPRRTILNKIANRHMRAVGAPIRLTPEDEQNLLSVIIAAGDFGRPQTRLDVRILVFNYLKKNGREDIFNGKLPGEMWVRNFLSRHAASLTIRATQNISSARAQKGEDEIMNYFVNLKETLKDVPPTNIMNYDETNCSDNPGSTKALFRRGVKYPERIINSTKGCISIMFSGTADGNFLPPYIVYRAEHLYDAWVVGGPDGARYNCTKSGWFDSAIFEDYFRTVVVEWAKKLPGPKVVIGDNLSSHLNPDVVKLCEKHNIRFAFLPPNSTHLTQPLDVAFFGPLKRQWRKILLEYKIQNPNQNTLNKKHFPNLLVKLIENSQIRQSDNIKSGFRAAGICPLNPQQVLKKIPEYHTDPSKYKIDESLLEYLKQSRAPNPMVKKRSKKLNTEPGKSVSTADINVFEEKYGKSKSITHRPEMRKKQDRQKGIKELNSKCFYDNVDFDMDENINDVINTELELVENYLDENTGDMIISKGLQKRKYNEIDLESSSSEDNDTNDTDKSRKTANREEILKPKKEIRYHKKHDKIIDDSIEEYVEEIHDKNINKATGKQFRHKTEENTDNFTEEVLDETTGIVRTIVITEACVHVDNKYSQAKDIVIRPNRRIYDNVCESNKENTSHTIRANNKKTGHIKILSNICINSAVPKLNQSYKKGVFDKSKAVSEYGIDKHDFTNEIEFLDHYGIDLEKQEYMEEQNNNKDQEKMKKYENMDEQKTIEEQECTKYIKEIEDQENPLYLPEDEETTRHEVEFLDPYIDISEQENTKYQENMEKQENIFKIMDYCTKKKNIKKKAEDSETDISGDVSLRDSSDAEYFELEEEEHEEEYKSGSESSLIFNAMDVISLTDLQKDQFILVKFEVQKSFRYYIGKIIDIVGVSLTVKFMRKKQNNLFHWPQVEDVSVIFVQDVVKILTYTECRRGLIRINDNIESFNLT